MKSGLMDNVDYPLGDYLSFARICTSDDLKVFIENAYCLFLLRCIFHREFRFSQPTPRYRKKADSLLLSKVKIFDPCQLKGYNTTPTIKSIGGRKFFTRTIRREIDPSHEIIWSYPIVIIINSY